MPIFQGNKNGKKDGAYHYDSSGSLMPLCKPPKNKINISEFGENDILVIHADRLLTKEQRELISENVNEVLNSDSKNRVLLLECNFECSIIKKV